MAQPMLDLPPGSEPQQEHQNSGGEHHRQGVGDQGGLARIGDRAEQAGKAAEEVFDRSVATTMVLSSADAWYGMKSPLQIFQCATLFQ